MKPASSPPEKCSMSTGSATHPCSQCRTPISLSKEQRTRVRRGLPVFCGSRCIQLHRHRTKPKPRLPKIQRHCEECAVLFTLNNVQSWKLRTGKATQFFCSKSCRTKHTARTSLKFRASVQAANMARIDELKEQMVEMRKKAAQPEVVARMRETMKARGHKPRVRGGNGQGLTAPQAALWVELWQLTGVEWIPEYPIKTGLGRRGCARAYKVDLAHPTLRLAIECDGPSHKSLSRQAQDRKKEAILSSLGWQVLRFSNREIMENTAACAQTVSSTTLK